MKVYKPPSITHHGKEAPKLSTTQKHTRGSRDDYEEEPPSPRKSAAKKQSSRNEDEDEEPVRKTTTRKPVVVEDDDEEQFYRKLSEKKQPQQTKTTAAATTKQKRLSSFEDEEEPPRRAATSGHGGQTPEALQKEVRELKSEIQTLRSQVQETSHLQTQIKDWLGDVLKPSLKKFKDETEASLQHLKKQLEEERAARKDLEARIAELSTNGKRLSAGGKAPSKAPPLFDEEEEQPPTRDRSNSNSTKQRASVFNAKSESLTSASTKKISTSSTPAASAKKTNTRQETWSVAKWLKDIGMEQYIGSFERRGYEDKEKVADLAPSDLNTLNVVTASHRRILLTEASALSPEKKKEASEPKEEERPRKKKEVSDSVKDDPLSIFD